jgi:hypothetical protein
MDIQCYLLSGFGTEVVLFEVVAHRPTCVVALKADGAYTRYYFVS